MKTELKTIAVLQAGKVFAVLYTIVAVVMLPVALIALVVGPNPKGAASALPALGVVVLYPLVGFVSGVILAALYNVAAKWVGGIRFTLEQSE